MCIVRKIAVFKELYLCLSSVVAIDAHVISVVRSEWLISDQCSGKVHKYTR